MIQWLPVIGQVLGRVFDVIDKAVPDKDLRERIKLEIATQDWQAELKELEARKEIITAEATGHSWLQRSWRPLLMLMFGYMIFHNFVLVPVIQAFYPRFPTVIMPDGVWNILALGVGGYVIGRSGEKIISIWKGKS